MKKERKGKQRSKTAVPEEWVVTGTISPPSNEKIAIKGDSLAEELLPNFESKSESQNETCIYEKSTSVSLKEFIHRDLEQPEGRELEGKTMLRVRDQGSSVLSTDVQFIKSSVINHLPHENSIQEQSSSFSDKGYLFQISQRVQVVALDNGAENDQAKDLSKSELSVEETSGFENNNSSIFSKEENTRRDVASVVEKLKTSALAINKPEMSMSQIEMNDHEQEDEVLALKAIYRDDVLEFEREDGSPRVFKISVHVEILENIDITVSLPSFVHRHEPSESPSRTSLKDSTLAENTYKFKVQHLPPIVLTCVLPLSYPSYMPPQFMILAYWLDFVSLSKLCSALDSIWSEDQGQVVVYKWAEWLRSSSLSELEFNHEVLLDPYGAETEVDWRAISGCSSPDVDIPRLIQYNDEKNNELFCSSLHVCNICFIEYPGTEFAKLPCQHYFCWKCMETYSHVHVKDGTVNKLNCPDPKCGASIPPGLLKHLLGDEAFDRWESLLLQKTLDSMTDVVYCPRCLAVCLEDEDNHAQCARCFYSFCSVCRDRRHVGKTCLTPEIRLQILQERERSGKPRGEQEKKEKNLINELISMKKILHDAKQCPSCKMAISKIEGCNKMTCSNCGQYFCYRCNKAINGYDHFSGAGCVLIEQEQIQNWDRAMNGHQLQQIAQVQLLPHLTRPCPNCGQNNVKQGNNNHIFCWSCQNHYCALCLKVVRRSTEHYGRKGCKQHTANYVL